jgi:hypothetical protein
MNRRLKTKTVIAVLLLLVLSTSGVTTQMEARTPANASQDVIGDVHEQNDMAADENVISGETTYANLDGSKARKKEDGTIKAAVYALCNNPVSKMRRYVNNVNNAAITISNGPSLGICTIDFGFQVDDRYIIAAATHPDVQLGVTVLTASGNTARFVVWHAAADAAKVGGDIYVVVY